MPNAAIGSRPMRAGGMPVPGAAARLVVGREDVCVVGPEDVCVAGREDV
ncbi:hypothetical protein ACFWZ2_25785 [Streptomyces sp. NPDC059002]